MKEIALGDIMWNQIINFNELLYFNVKSKFNICDYKFQDRCSLIYVFII